MAPTWTTILRCGERTFGALQGLARVLFVVGSQTRENRGVAALRRHCGEGSRLTISISDSKAPGSPVSGATVDRGGPWAVQRLVMGLILLLGVALRLWQFVFNRSLWLDEAYLASSFAVRDTWALLTEPLANGQVAPLGFLLAAKACFDWLGGADWTLRLVPFLSGLLTLLVAWRLSLLAWRHALARVLFVGLVSFSPVLIYYTSEFKQYGGDVLVSMLLVWACMRFDAASLRASLLRLGWVGVLGVWFSHPSVFPMAAVGLVLGVESTMRRQWRAVAGLLVVGLLWVLSFGLHYAAGIGSMAANTELAQFWLTAFAPMPPFEPGDAAWYWDSGLGLVYLAFRHVGIAHHVALPEWNDGLTVGLAFGVCAGWLVAWRLGGRWMAVLILPVFLTLLASGLQLYPFRSRLILFLVPLLWMALATAVEVACVGWRRTNGTADLGWYRWRTLSAAGLSLALLVLVAEPTARHALVPYNGSDIKGALAFVQAQRLPGDHLMIDTWSSKAFNFYQDAFDLGGMSRFVYRPTPNAQHDALATAKRICRAGETGRTWLVLSHRFDQRQTLLGVLQSIKPFTAQWEGNGAGAYLLDLASTPFCQRYRPSPAG